MASPGTWQQEAFPCKKKAGVALQEMLAAKGRAVGSAQLGQPIGDGSAGQDYSFLPFSNILTGSVHPTGGHQRGWGPG